MESKNSAIECLIIGPGSQFQKHEKAIELFINKFKPIVLAINTKTLSKPNLIDLRIACINPFIADVDTHLNLPEPLVILSMLQRFSQFLKKGY